MDLTQAPKQFCDNINLGFSDEFFLMAVSSGQTGVVYALTPQHAKRLSQMLVNNIEKYEKQFGELKTQWTENVPSPIQADSLGGTQK